MHCRAPAADELSPPAARGHLRSLIPLAVVSLLFAACGRPEPQQPAAPEQTTEPPLNEITRPVRGGALHLVRIDLRGDAPSFAPAELRIRKGDVVRFVMTSSRPESIAFDTIGLTPEQSVFVRENQLARGVLLIQPGQVYQVEFRGAPVGTYPFHSLPHGDRGMRGAVAVE